VHSVQHLTGSFSAGSVVFSIDPVYHNIEQI
jgi:hypothetical protein